jgi:ATP-dependent exoDNAse (exonuclease V) alpha subunit
MSRAPDQSTHCGSGDQLRAALVADWWTEAACNPAGTLILARSREDARQLNNLARRVVEDAGRLSGPSVSNEFGSFRTGDQIVARDTTRGRRYGVSRGDLGTVAAVEAGGLVVELDRGERVELPERYLPHVGHGYASTVHASQGSTVDRAYVYGAGSREWLYVAASRSREDARIYLSTARPDVAEVDLPKR